MHVRSTSAACTCDSYRRRIRSLASHHSMRMAFATAPCLGFFFGMASLGKRPVQRGCLRNGFRRPRPLEGTRWRPATTSTHGLYARSRSVEVRARVRTARLRTGEATRP